MHTDFPIAASFPHFLNADQALLNSISGLNPSEEKHGSYLIVEPVSDVKTIRFIFQIFIT